MRELKIKASELSFLKLYTAAGNNKFICIMCIYIHICTNILVKK